MDDTFEPLSDLPEPPVESAAEPEAAPVAAAPFAPASAGPPRYDAILSIPVTARQCRSPA